VLAPTLFGIQFGIIGLIGMTLPIGVATKPRSRRSTPRRGRDHDGKGDLP
jgi:hypothetical protein